MAKHEEAMKGFWAEVAEKADPKDRLAVFGEVERQDFIKDMRLKVLSVRDEVRQYLALLVNMLVHRGWRMLGRWSGRRRRSRNRHECMNAGF